MTTDIDREALEQRVKYLLSEIDELEYEYAQLGLHIDHVYDELYDAEQDLFNHIKGRV